MRAGHSSSSSGPQQRWVTAVGPDCQACTALLVALAQQPQGAQGAPPPSFTNNTSYDVAASAAAAAPRLLLEDSNAAVRSAAELGEWRLERVGLFHSGATRPCVVLLVISEGRGLDSLSAWPAALERLPWYSPHPTVAVRLVARAPYADGALLAALAPQASALLGCWAYAEASLADERSLALLRELAEAALEAASSTAAPQARGRRSAAAAPRGGRR
eukprot:m51a1_g12451 hypothetical protein (217) ;mRNA; r:16-1066